MTVLTAGLLNGITPRKTVCNNKTNHFLLMSVNLHKKVQFFRFLDSNSHNSWLHALHCYSAMLKSNFLNMLGIISDSFLLVLWFSGLWYYAL